MAFFALVSCGCATTYQPMGLTGGYEESVISPGVYELYFLGNGATNKKSVEEYWHRRASELCGGEYAHEYTTTTRKLSGGAAYAGGTLVPFSVSYPQLRGIVTCTEGKGKGKGKGAE